MQESFPTLFSPYKLGAIELKNRIVMAPMTRSRAIGNAPNDLVAQYYADRASAGLLITEGTSPSPNGIGYARIPGLFNTGQINAWKAVTDAVHAKGGKIFVQLMHTGRISHPLNMPPNAEVIGASAIAASNIPMWTDQQQMQPLPIPRALTTEEIPALIAEYTASAKAAIEAGFDGVEIHAANGYLPMQFLSAGSNQRDDQYGGSPENRNRFVLELTASIANAIGTEKTGIRLSPFNTFNDITEDDTVTEQYTALLSGLKHIGVVYVHFLTFAIPPSTLQSFIDTFGGTIILNGAYTAERAETDLAAGLAALISFGEPFIANPDLVDRIKHGKEIVKSDPNTHYTPGAVGYTDYPFAK